MSMLMVACIASVAAADQWNDRTILSFDAPMMVPGATLAPGTYVFKLMDTKANRHIVQIFKQDENQLMATTFAVPTKRLDSRGDVVMRLSPTSSGAPAAIKAWFYPGSLYGHEFVYPDWQATDIAQRTKTLVLSGEAPDSDMQQGTLYTYDATGSQQSWQIDQHVQKEWDDWSRNSAAGASAEAADATARVAVPGTAKTRESTAPAVRSEPAGMRVSIGELEDHPARYIGQTINVTADVEDVFGPRLFKIDEADWADLDGEVLVYLPGDMAALVREDDRVTITGTMRKFPQAEIGRELAALDTSAVKFADRPILVARDIVGGNDNVALAIHVSRGNDARAKTTNRSASPDSRDASSRAAVGTSGRAAAATVDAPAASAAAPKPLTDAATVGRANRELIGRQVALSNVEVARTGPAHGFWIAAGKEIVFVLPGPDALPAAPASGQTISVAGMMLEMPKWLRERSTADAANERVYIYATAVN
jgi:hypothetical protein